LIVSGGVEIVSERSGLDGLEPQWRSLAELRGNAFIAPEWFAAWLDAPGATERAFVPVVRRPDGSLRGLLPLVTTRGALRTLRFAGGDFADRVHPVAAPEDEAAVARAAASALFEHGAARTVLRLDHIDVAAEWVDSLLAGRPALAASEDDRTVLPYIDLRELTWETFVATRSANFRNQLKRKLRTLERSPGVRFRRTLDSAELEGDLSVFFHLHDKRWQALGGGSTLADPHARRALAEFARAAFRAGWLRLWFLEIDGRPAAAWYGWRLGDRYAYYQAGFDPAWSSLSVGFLLLAHTVRAAFEEGAAVYDLLAGREPFKLRFANGELEVKTTFVSRRGGPGRAVAAAGVVTRRFGRRLPPALRARIRSLPKSARFLGGAATERTLRL
jgi:CelD/BcsL family acetyltransferase involved in cellulose biosynthesis